MTLAYGISNKRITAENGAEVAAKEVEGFFADLETGKTDEMLMGGFSEQRPLAAEDSAVFAEATNGMSAVRGGESAIFPFVVGDERRAVEVSAALERRGLLVPAIRYPTVARGEARLRIAISARHTAEQLAALAEAVQEVQEV